MPPVSVTIVACNEADRIGNAIESVRWADEVLVLDSGSVDGTQDVARQLGARVIETDWPGYREQKHRAVERARNDWVLSLDADEVVPAALSQEIQAVLVAPEAVAFEIARLGHWMGAPVHYGVWRPDRSVRLFHRESARWAGGLVHERVRVDGVVGRLRCDLLHFPYRGLREHLDTLNEYADLFVQQELDGGRSARWIDVVGRPLVHVVKALVLKAGLLDGVRGVCLGFLGAAGVWMKWSRLLRAQSSSESGHDEKKSG